MLWEKFYYEYRAGDVSHQKNAKWKQNALSLSLHMCVCVCVCMCDVCVYMCARPFKAKIQSSHKSVYEYITRDPPYTDWTLPREEKIRQMGQK